MCQLTAITKTLQQLNFLVFLFAFALALVFIIVSFLYQVGRGLHHIYTYADQQGRAEYKYYGTLAVCTLFVWNLLLKEQEAATLKMAGDVMDC